MKKLTILFLLIPILAFGQVEALIQSSGGSTPPTDTEKPIIGVLSLSGVGQTTVDLSWTAATDNVGVTGYKVWQDGVSTTIGNVLTYQVGGLSAGGQYNFEVSAFDAANNQSNLSNTINVTTNSPPPIGNTPVITNFRVDDTNKNRIYFDSSADITGLTTTGFVIQGKTISSVTLNGTNTTGHYFTISVAFDFWDNATIRLGEITDSSNSQATIYNFTLEAIANNIFEPTNYSKTMYVANNGSDSNNGTSISTPYLTLGKALLNTVANGNIIHVKAGLYPSETIASSSNGVSGTSTNPTVIQGYKTSIGDLNGVMYYNYPATPSSSEMPTFDGINRTSTFLDYAGRSYYIIRNIQILDYYRGFWSQNNTLTRGRIIDNCIVYKSYPVSIPSGGGGGSGIGMEGTIKSTSDSRIINSIVVNSSKTCFSILGVENLLIKNNKAYCNELDPANDIGITTDYYYEIASDYCIIDNNLAHKDVDINGGNNGHAGHGIAMKGSYVIGGGDVIHNLLQNNEVINIRGAYELRWDKVAFNVLKNNISRANVSNRHISSYEFTGFVHLLEGTHDNVIENNIGHDIDSFGYYGEFGEIAGNTSTRDNIIRNNIAYNLINVISAINWEGGIAIYTGDKYYNNTFYNSDNFSRLENTVSMVSFSIENNIITSITSQYKDQSTTGFSFDYNDIWNSWATSIGTNSININPNFVNLINFVPQGAIIVAPRLFGVEYDYNKLERETTTTIGSVKHLNE